MSCMVVLCVFDYVDNLLSEDCRHCASYSKPEYGGFQKFVVVPAVRAAELPYEIATAQGVVLPLGISTAAAGLYQKGFLALPYPMLKPEDQERTVIIWGGSSSVGSCAIQLAVASGVSVVTTASPANFEYCRKLGASQVYDYHDEDVEDQIVDALKGKTVVGAYHAVGGDGAVQTCARIVDRTKGKAIVVTVRGVPDEGIPSSVRAKASKLSLTTFVKSARSTKRNRSRLKRHLHERCWTLYMAGLSSQGAGSGESFAKARSIDRWRGVAIGAGWT